MTTTTASISINMDNVAGKLEGELEVFLYAGLHCLGSVPVDLGADILFDQDVKRYASNITSAIWTLFIIADMDKIVPWHMYAGPSVRFNDSAGQQLDIIFDYKGQSYVAPPGMEIQITNTGDATPTTYYTAPQSSAPPPMLAKPHGPVFPPPNSITLGPNQVAALGGDIDLVPSFVASLPDRSCGNCANYQFLNCTCSKSNRRNVDQNTQCFTDNFKSFDDRS